MEKFPRRVPPIPEDKQIKYISIPDSIKYVLSYFKIYAILKWINSSFIIFCILLLLLPLLSSLTIGSICGDAIAYFLPEHGTFDIESPFANYLNIAVMCIVVPLFTYLYVKRRRDSKGVYLKFATIFWLGNLSMFVYGIPVEIPQSFYIYPYVEHAILLTEHFNGDLSFLLVAPFLYIASYLAISFFDFWIPVILMTILYFCRSRVTKRVILAIYFIVMLLSYSFDKLFFARVLLKSLLSALIIYPISRYIDRKNSR